MHRLNPIVIKSADAAGSGEFEGYASTWQRDTHGDRIQRGAWIDSLARDEPIAMLWHHRPDEPIGAWIRFTEDDVGLLARGRLTLAIQRAKEAHALMRDGGVGLSVGFNVDPADMAWDDATQTNLIRRASLLETSIVAMPSNRGARVISVKQALSSRPEMEAFLKAQGFPNRVAKKLAAAAAGEIDLPARKSEPDIDWTTLALAIAASPLLDVDR